MNTVVNTTKELLKQHINESAAVIPTIAINLPPIAGEELTSTALNTITNSIEECSFLLNKEVDESNEHSVATFVKRCNTYMNKAKLVINSTLTLIK